MRLLHTTELRFQEFYGPKLPRYAILSHKWTENEVSYQKFLAFQREYDRERYSTRRSFLDSWYLSQASISSKYGMGYEKIVAACHFAANDTQAYRTPLALEVVSGPFTWIWIDTCCIDKSSSAELSEAINSMYNWYRDSTVCYAYLSDVSTDSDPNEMGSEFRQSRWFTRGWTLQELLAPKTVCFLNHHWQIIGLRQNLSKTIDDITGIPAVHVNAFRYSGRGIARVADKFSWAAKRQTSREEDEAYCLLGLFDVNMPVLYGEGRKAFQRLQAEIVRSCNDESVFLWSLETRSGAGLLAEYPMDFARYATGSPHNKSQSSWPTRLFFDPAISSRAVYTITNQGFELEIPQKFAEYKEILYPLNCHYDRASSYAISLVRYGHIWSRSPYTGDQLALVSARYGISVRRLRDIYEDLENSTSVSVADEVEPHILDKCDDVGLYIVPRECLWNREDLRRWGSRKIYCRTFGYDLFS